MRIVAAALKVFDLTLSAPPPARHSALIYRFVNLRTGIYIYQWRQGFLTNKGTFVNRREAAQIAYEAGQIKEPKDTLFSEDLW